MAVPDAAAFKEQGNKRFNNGDYAIAEGLYSQAQVIPDERGSEKDAVTHIIADPEDPKLYTNRAMARIKLQRFDDAISDCNACISLSPNNMKAFFQLAHAQLNCKDFNSALDNARRAHDIAVTSDDKSLAAITQLILCCKKELWNDKERRRQRENSELEQDVIGLLERERAQAVADCRDESDVADVAADWDAKIVTLSSTFQRAREAAHGRKRQVPNWAVDDITFGIMVDPVITKAGKSYERASILEYLKRSGTDPITRQPLDVSDLRPNLDLKAACEEFLDENGWAVDW